jgi:hypothetical protein
MVWQAGRLKSGSKLPQSKARFARTIKKTNFCCGEKWMENDGSLIVNGIRIDPDVLRKDGVRRCAEVNCVAACCSDGVWLREDEAPHILAWADTIKACLPAERHDESTWFEQGNNELGTASVDDPLRPDDTCCVFLQPDRKCALQVVSQAHSLGWPGLKPYYCALYPLYFENGVLLVDDATPLNVTGAMCRQAKPPRRAMYKLYKEEAKLVLGEDGYRELCEKAKGRRARRRPAKEPAGRRRSRGEKS